MKYQILFSGKNKKNINLLSAEFAQRGVKVNVKCKHIVPPRFWFYVDFFLDFT